MLRPAVVLLSLIALAAGFTPAASSGASVGPPQCIDPSPDGGGSPPFEGFGTPNHTIVQRGDLCPGDTDVWSFSTLAVPIDQYIGIRVSVASGDVSIYVEPKNNDIPYRPPFTLEPGEKHDALVGPAEAHFDVRVTGESPDLVEYTLQVCRGITNPCQFAQVQDPAPGDANCDGSIDAYDAFDILGFVAGVAPPPVCVQAAELLLDGRLTPHDALLILQYVAGLIDQLPVP